MDIIMYPPHSSILNSTVDKILIS